MSLCLNCVCYTIKGRDVNQNRYIQIFNMWLSQLMLCGDLQASDAIYFYSDTETIKYLQSDTSHTAIVDKLKCTFKIFSHPPPECLADGMMLRFGFNEYTQDIYMYCDIDVLIVNSLHSVTNSMKPNTIYVHNEGLLTDKNYGAAFQQYELEKFVATSPGFSSGKFFIYGKELHKMFFSALLNLYTTLSDKTFYTADQPYFNKIVYHFMNNKICNVDLISLQSSIKSNLITRFTNNTVFIDLYGVPGDGEFHFNKMIKYYILLRSGIIGQSISAK